MPGYLDEYLVRLGVSTDDAGLAKLQGALKGITSAVSDEEASFASLAIGLVKFQIEVASAAAALIGTVGKMAESVAVADQEYRLFGLTMFMNADAAKKLKITLDTLGQPLGMIVWDAELHKRAVRLNALQDAMQAGLRAGGAEADFIKIRDLRNEMAAAEVEWIYFKQSLTSSLVKAFGPEIDALLKRLTEFNNWFSAHLPEITKRVNEYLVPALREAWKVIKGVGEELKLSAVAFTNLVGVLSGDQSIEGATFKAEKFATAMGKVEKVVAVVANAVTDLGIIILHTATALAMLAQGNFKGAWMEGQDSGRYIFSGGAGRGANARGFIDGVGPGGETEADNPAYNPETQTSTELGMFFKSAWRGYVMPWTAVTDLWSKRNGDGPDSQANSALGGQATPDLIGAIIATESGGKSYGPPHVNTNGSIDYGLMGLNDKSFPGAATMTPEQNVAAGTKYFNQLLAKYGGDTKLALTAYNSGPGNVDRVLRHGGDPTTALGHHYAATVEHHMPVTVSTLNINVPPGSDGRRIARDFTAELQTRSNIVMATGWVPS